MLPFLRLGLNNPVYDINTVQDVIMFIEEVA